MTVDPVRDILRAFAAAPDDARTPVLLIDGRSGSGKTTLAAQLATTLAGSRLIRMDDIYPGWDGLASASESIRRDLLAPLARGEDGGWRAWDWHGEQSGAWHPVPPGPTVIVEGCGALTTASRVLARVGVWVELDSPTRKRRALERDGAAYEPFWDRWAAQEADFVRRERPRSQADLVIDGHTIAA